MATIHEFLENRAQRTCAADWVQRLDDGQQRFNARQALRILVEKDSVEEERAMGIACGLGNCGVLLAIEADESVAYPVNCPEFPDGQAI